ncbi:unnamed protein product, partial [Mesorhabditis spiculigera]
MSIAHDLYIVFGEVDGLVALFRQTRVVAQGHEETGESLLRNLHALKLGLKQKDLYVTDLPIFLKPFLDVIICETTTADITKAALESISVFIRKGIFNEVKSGNARKAVEAIANAVTQAKFVGGANTGGDECVLFKILAVLTELLTSQSGHLLSDTAVCDMLQSCFRICFAENLSLILREAAKSALNSMVTLLFKRFPELATNEVQSGQKRDKQKLRREMANLGLEVPMELIAVPGEPTASEAENANPAPVAQEAEEKPEEPPKPEKPAQMPYGQPSALEAFRFMCTLINPRDDRNTEQMIRLGLDLLVAVFESTDIDFGKSPKLRHQVTGRLSRALIALLDSKKLTILASTARVAFHLFERSRDCLKLQMEAYFQQLQTIIASPPTTVSNEKKEFAMSTIVRLWQIPGLVNELYLNYDNDLYCSNLFEDLIKLFSENAFPLHGQESLSFLGLEALLVVVDYIKLNCDELSEEQLTRQNNDLTHLQNRHASNRTDFDMSRDDVYGRKKKKQIITEATALFNTSPKKAVEYLREKGIVDNNPLTIAEWLRVNPHLDKKMIADYISNRKHAEILKAYVYSFNFNNTRLDQALRVFLETFRLPGESAEISMVMQHFAEHWFQSNNKPFVDADAAFTLSYAVIMLNTDQHNPQVGRNQPRMTVESFKKNLKGTNGPGDFDPKLLEDIFASIKGNEIVMPAEQTGLVKENYLWKVLLHRAQTSDGIFMHVPTGWNDQDLFRLTWGPAFSALSYVYDKCDEEEIIKKVMNGYYNCASISAFFGMSNVLDNLIILLCKFSGLMSNTDEIQEETLKANIKQYGVGNYGQHSVGVALGDDFKALTAAKAIFELVLGYGDTLHEGWKYVVDCLIQLYRARMLPNAFTEVVDFVDSKGWVSINREYEKPLEISKSESNFLFWFPFGPAAEAAAPTKKPIWEDAAYQAAKEVLEQCHLDQIIARSTDLPSSAVGEFLSAILHVSQSAVSRLDKNNLTAAFQAEPESEDSLVFCLELLTKLLLTNRDRINDLWTYGRAHMEWIFATLKDKSCLLAERAIVDLLHIVDQTFHIFAVADEGVAWDMLPSLGLLKKLTPKEFFVHSRQISNGLGQLLYNSAANIHQAEEWNLVTTLLEAAGAAAHEEPPHEGPHGSDNESAGNAPQDWIHLDHRDALKARDEAQRSLLGDKAKDDHATLVLRQNLGRHEPSAFFTVCDILKFLLRDTAHVTPENFECFMRCLRTLMEASVDGGKYAAGPASGEAQNRLRSEHTHKSLAASKSEAKELGEQEKMLTAEYTQRSLLLLDLCHQLHSNAEDIYKKWAKPGADATFEVCPIVLKPLLQAIARLCCDTRAEVRHVAYDLLSSKGVLFWRALLSTNPKINRQLVWNVCYAEILFPLLSELLDEFSPLDHHGMEETRLRVLQLVTKSFLMDLDDIAESPMFTELWLRLLDYLEKYCRVDRLGNLNETVPEILKNMLLVFHSKDLFNKIPALYQITIHRVGKVWLGLVQETIPPPSAAPVERKPASLVNQAVSPQPSRIFLSAANGTSEPTTNPTETRQPPEATAPISIVPEPKPEYEVVVHSGASSPLTSPPILPSVSHPSIPASPPPSAQVYRYDNVSHQPSHPGSTIESPPPQQVPQYQAAPLVQQYNPADYGMMPNQPTSAAPAPIYHPAPQMATDYPPYSHPGQLPYHPMHPLPHYTYENQMAPNTSAPMPAPLINQENPPISYANPLMYPMEGHQPQIDPANRTSAFVPYTGSEHPRVHPKHMN